MNPIEMKVLMNHIYEYKKGVRQMVLFTCPKEYEEMATRRLSSQHIDYVCQSAGSHNVNLYFGRRECLNAIRLIVTRPLNQLTPEEDFILGAMLGYDLCAQCERYCERKERCCKHKEHCREHIEHCREHIEHCRDCSDPHCNHTLNMSS
ncbi:MAG: DUF2023 family protein [Prevotella sp.]|nr:DUF2023 family protein [Prevotella sp.]